MHDHNSKICSLFLIENTLNLHTRAIRWSMHFCSCSVLIFMGYEALEDCIQLILHSRQTCANYEASICSVFKDNKVELFMKSIVHH